MTGVIGPHNHVQALPDLAIGPKASSQLSLGLVLRPKHYISIVEIMARFDQSRVRIFLALQCKALHELGNNAGGKESNKER